MTQTPNLKYRPDVDGLRALAVSVVVIFHFFPFDLPGGFLGVDVFFVISGFLVTKIIKNQLDKQSFSLLDFYQRRVRRLFPALILILIFCLLVGAAMLVAEEFKNLGKHVFFGSFFSANIALFMESGYFDKSADLKPLRHLWSLGIEEQFYFIWPLILMTLARLRRKSIATLTLVFIMATSLIANLTVGSDHQSLTFYMLPTRLWELALGGVLAILPQRYETAPKKWAHIVSALGLALIFFSIFKMTREVAQVVPTIGTALFIWATPRAWPNRILSFRPLVYIGLISYPVYLWHWPFISFAHILIPTQISLTIKWTLIALSFIFAALTYEFLEKPVKSKNTKASILLVILFVIAVIGGTTYLADGFPSRYPGVEKSWSQKVEFQPDREAPQLPNCDERFPKTTGCPIADPTRPPTMILVGDSHATHYFLGLKDVYGARGENLLSIARSGTSPLKGLVSRRNPDTTLDDVLNYALHEPSIHTVILGAFWSNYLEESGTPVANFMYKNVIGDTIYPVETAQEVIFKNGLIRTLKELENAGKKIVLILDIPNIKGRLEYILPRPWIRASFSDQIPLTEVLSAQNKTRETMRDILKGHPTVAVIDPISFLCDSTSCHIFKDGVFLYADEHHLSIEGSKLLVEYLKSQGVL